MTAYAFHLNMQNFGGGTIARNDAFHSALRATGRSTYPYYVVAGFTEIRNCLAAPTAIGDFVTELDPGLTTTCVIWCGVAASARASDPPRHEYAGISWDRAVFTAARVGHLYLRVDGWQERGAAGPAEGTSTIGPPDGIVGADRRGMVYTAGALNGTNYIFGFLHDMYNVADRGQLLGTMGEFLRLIRAAVVGFDNCRVVIGGDFNVTPRDPSARTGLKGLAATWGAPNFEYMNTTESNPFDWWLFHDTTDRRNADCSVWTRMRKDWGGPSDHAAIRVEL